MPARATSESAFWPLPTITLPSDAYGAQFAIARGVETLRAEVATHASEAAALQKALLARRLAAGGRERELLDAYQVEITAVTGSAPATNPSNGWWLPPRGTETLRWLATQLELLAESVDGRTMADYFIGGILKRDLQLSMADH